MSRSRLMKTSLLSVAAALLIAAVFAASSFVAHTIAAPQPVIVELKSDPVVVAKALAEARGQNFDSLTYRQQLVAEQNQFLTQLSAAGVSFNLVSVDAPNGTNGEITNIQFRYNYVFNGLTLAVPASAIKTIEGMNQVKSVHKDEPITMQLDHAVNYVRAPSLYGNPPQVHQADSLNNGGVEGQGIYIAIIDTGIDWTHPMFGGDPTPPRFGVGPAAAAVNTNQKVAYYLNLTAGAVQDDFGHGTHVSAITAGYLGMAPSPDGLPLTADDVAIHGVAPQAKLMGYKVLSTVGAGGGVYQLNSSAVRNLPAGVSVSFTDAGGNSITQVEVPANSNASFNVNITVNGEAVPANPTQIEWYVIAARTDGGQTLRMPFQYRAIAPTVAMFAPTLNNAGNTEFSGNPATDINGNYQLTFAATGTNAPAKLRIEESSDNGTSWALLADVPASQTAYDINGRGNGTFQYRVRGLYTVESGLMPGPASAVKTVVVDRRVEADATSLIEARIVDGSLSFTGGVWQFDQTLRNASSSTSVFAPLRFVITSITSNSGTVRVKNADDSGNGVSSPATFDYTSQVGADQQLSPGESTASRRLQFNDPAMEMFTFTVVVKGYFPDAVGASSGGGAPGAPSGGGASGSGSSGSSTSSGLSLPGGTRVMQVTVNPLTKSVTAKLL